MQINFVQTKIQAWRLYYLEIEIKTYNNLERTHAHTIHAYLHISISKPNQFKKNKQADIALLIKFDLYFRLTKTWVFQKYFTLR